MLGQLLPQRIDNAYRGSKLAPWLFALILSLKTAQSLLSIFRRSRGAVRLTPSKGIR